MPYEQKYEQKPGDIVIFKNDNPSSENAPAYTGKGLDLEGNEIRIALWVKEGPSRKFFSGKLEPPYKPQGGRAAAKPAAASDIDEDEDELPF